MGEWSAAVRQAWSPDQVPTEMQGRARQRHACSQQSVHMAFFAVLRVMRIVCAAAAAQQAQLRPCGQQHAAVVHITHLTLPSFQWRSPMTRSACGLWLRGPAHEQRGMSTAGTTVPGVHGHGRQKHGRLCSQDLACCLCSCPTTLPRDRCVQARCGNRHQRFSMQSHSCACTISPPPPHLLVLLHDLLLHLLLQVQQLALLTAQPGPPRLQWEAAVEGGWC